VMTIGAKKETGGRMTARFPESELCRFLGASAYPPLQRTSTLQGRHARLVGLAALFGVAFEHLAKVLVFATGGFEIEHEIFDAEAKPIEGFL
jgi:hypothetical protein